MILFLVAIPQVSNRLQSMLNDFEQKRVPIIMFSVFLSFGIAKIGVKSESEGATETKRMSR